MNRLTSFLFIIATCVIFGGLGYGEVKKKATLEQRVAELEAVASQQAAYNEFLEGRTEYLKAHIDALEQGTRVNRASLHVQ